MAFNNLPDLKQMLSVEFNPQVLYDVLLALNNTLQIQRDKITALEKEVERLKNGS